MKVGMKVGMKIVWQIPYNPHHEGAGYYWMVLD